MNNRQILETIKKNKEYCEKLEFILRHRNNVWSEEIPTFDEHNIKYIDMYSKLKKDYDSWLDSEV